MTNTLYYGDNLDWLRNERVFPDAFVDLVYLDPPFNSNRNYNVLFKGQAGHEAQAQIHAFTDTWEWSEQEFSAVNRSQRVPEAVKDALDGMVKLAGKNPLTGYLVMMAPRLVELRRVLKPTGSLYLHCDPTASHYLKLLLDAVFGPLNFLSEIIWKRTSAHSSAKRPGPVHDVVLLYSMSDKYIWNQQYHLYKEDYIKSHYRNQDADGRAYQLSDLMAAGTRRGSSGQPWRGIDPAAKGNHWKFTIENLEELDSKGIIHWPNKGGLPRYKRYLDNMHGVPVQDVWTDIEPINSQADERLGYPTQKPLALLRRIIEASSKPGDTVLDPFCGCGTAVVAAEELGRQWLGIDITSLAISVVEKRVRQTHPGAQFVVQGLPDSEEDARDLAERNKYDFQDWVVLKLGGQPIREAAPGKAVKGADAGVDGVIYFEDAGGTHKAYISVKGGQNYGVQMLRDLDGALNDKGGVIGVLVIVGQPTGPMRDLANRSPMYESKDSLGNLHHYSRLQIVTVADLIAKGGSAINIPLHYEGQTLQTAQRGQRKEGEQMHLLGS
jgi:DNA modification methylase